MKNNKMGDKLFLLALLGKAIVIAMLAFGLVLTACSTDDDVGRTRPTLLDISADYSKAMATLDEIIAYFGTPAATKEKAEAYKASFEAYSTSWDTVRGTVVVQINLLIDQIPGPEKKE